MHFRKIILSHVKQEFGGARLEAVATTQGRTDDCTNQDGTMGIEQRRFERET